MWAWTQLMLSHFWKEINSPWAWNKAVFNLSKRSQSSMFTNSGKQWSKNPFSYVSRRSELLYNRCKLKAWTTHGRYAQLSQSVVITESWKRHEILLWSNVSEVTAMVSKNTWYKYIRHMKYCTKHYSSNVFPASSLREILSFSERLWFVA